MNKEIILREWTSYMLQGCIVPPWSSETTTSVWFSRQQHPFVEPSCWLIGTPCHIKWAPRSSYRSFPNTWSETHAQVCVLLLFVIGFLQYCPKMKHINKFWFLYLSCIVIYEKKCILCHVLYHKYELYFCCCLIILKK